MADTIWNNPPEWLREAAQRYQGIIERLNAGAPFEEFHFIQLTTVYLIANILYYEQMAPPMDDHTFDKLCRYLLEHFEELEEARVYGVGTLIEKEALEAGTGYHISRLCPTAVRNITFFMGRV